ncbi:MAG: hypothetical protein Q8904_07810 [Bacteroidota bacterium]|nr:hypothetical protein [Bacteroidota bacterium]
MEIVPTSIPKKSETGLEELVLRKAELKQQIKDQEQRIVFSTRKLFRAGTISSFIFSSVRKKMNLVDGFLIGFKVIRSIRKFIRRFK